MLFKKTTRKSIKEYKPIEASTALPYKIQFGRIFIICVSIMFIDQIFRLFESAPVLITWGNEIYHTLYVLITVSSMLSASIAAAIIFYYTLEFYNKKKDMSTYIDLRRDFLFIMYTHIELLSNLTHFATLKKPFNRYTTVHIEPFLYLFSCLNLSDEDFLEDLMQLLISEKGSIPQNYRYHIETLKTKSNRLYFKNSIDHFDTLFDLYEELETWCEHLEIPDNQIDDAEVLSNLTMSYIEFLKHTCSFYVDVNVFMTSIIKFNLRDFLRLLA